MGDPPSSGVVKLTESRPLKGETDSDPGALGVVEGVAEL